MPDSEQLLSELTQIVNDHQILAIYWHAYYGGLLILLLSGRGITRNLMASLISIPFFSVSSMAWASGNFFNGTFFMILPLFLLGTATRFPDEKIIVTSPRAMLFGFLIFAFGLAYPHFLETDSFLKYFYAAPTGLIPCPTLSASIGMTIMINEANLKGWPLLLPFTGVFYAVVGILYLGVLIDIVLLFGSLIMIFSAIPNSLLRGLLHRR